MNEADLEQYRHMRNWVDPAYWELVIRTLDELAYLRNRLTEEQEAHMKTLQRMEELRRISDDLKLDCKTDKRGNRVYIMTCEESGQKWVRVLDP